MQAILNQMKFQAALTGNSNINALRGLVTNFNPQTWKITVTFYPLTDENGYAAGTVEIPLASTWLGNGWGAYFAPALDTQVTILFENSDYQIPIGMLFNFDSVNNPLQGIQSGEMWLVHQSGSLIKLTNDGNVTINGNIEIDLTAPTVNITTTANVNINASSGVINFNTPQANFTGNVSIDGTLDADNGSLTMSGGNLSTTGSIQATGDVTGGSISLEGHVHGGVTSGGSNTDPPT
jgi:phage baseplate assembly protein V